MAGPPTAGTKAGIARRRMVAQRLSAPHAGSAAEVVGTLLAVQAENPVQSAWAVASRTTARDARDLAGLLVSGAVLRTHVLRPTWHYVLREDLDWLTALTAPRVRPAVERGLLAALDADEVEMLAGTVLETLASTPDLTRAQVGGALRQRVPPVTGSRLTGQVLMLLMARLELDRLVCSGRPVDGEHSYATWDDRIGTRTVLDGDAREEALARLALRYLAGHGPATVGDLSYWATLPLGDVRRGVEAVRERLESFQHDGRTYWHLPRTSDPDGAVEPAGHLLQVLDEMYRGYQDSRWAIDAEGIVPRGRETSIGMALVDGQLVAGMKRTLRRGSVRFELAPYRPLSDRERAAVDAAAARYGDFLGLAPEVVLVPDR